MKTPMSHLSSSDLRWCVQSHEKSGPCILSLKHRPQWNRRKRPGCEEGQSACRCELWLPFLSCGVHTDVGNFSVCEQSRGVHHGSRLCWQMKRRRRKWKKRRMKKRGRREYAHSAPIQQSLQRPSPLLPSVCLCPLLVLPLTFLSVLRIYPWQRTERRWSCGPGTCSLSSSADFCFAPPFVSRYGSVSYSLLSREADRVILTRCQQDGANQNTFQAISTLLGNKTPNEVICSIHFVIGPWRGNSPPISSPAGFLPFSGFDGFV